MLSLDDAIDAVETVVDPREVRGRPRGLHALEVRAAVRDERRAVEVALEALAPIEQLDAARALASWRASP